MDLFQFIITNIFMLAVGAMLYLVARTLPRIELEPETEKKGLFEKWITSEVPEKIDKALNGFLFKTLKKTRVLLLRFDNSLGEHIKKVNPETHGAAKKHLDFSGMTPPPKETSLDSGKPRGGEENSGREEQATSDKGQG